MAKKQSGDGQNKRTRRPVDLDPELAKDIKALAGLLDISIPDYVNTRLAPIVAEELRRVLQERTSRDKEQGEGDATA